MRIYQGGDEDYDITFAGRAFASSLWGRGKQGTKRGRGVMKFTMGRGEPDSGRGKSGRGGREVGGCGRWVREVGGDADHIFAFTLYPHHATTSR